MKKKIVPGSPDDYKLRRASTLSNDPILALWEPYLYFGMINLVYGYPGSGKSSFVTDLIARRTRHGAMPDGHMLDNPITAVYQCNEFGTEGLFRQMLTNAKADLDAIGIIEGKKITVTDPRVYRAVRELDAKILVIDPIQNYVKANMNNAQRMREELSELGQFAAETDCAVILIGHFTKKIANEDQYQGGGSSDIAAIARSHLQIHRMSKLSPLRYIHQVKCSVAQEGVDFGFEISGLGAVNYIGPIEAEEMVDLEEEVKHEYSPKLDAAIGQIEKILRDGDISSQAVLDQLTSKGFSMATIRRAKSELCVQSIRQNDRSWAWHLP